MGFRRVTFSLATSDWGQERWEKANKGLSETGNFSSIEEERMSEMGRQSGIEITKWFQNDRYSTLSTETMCPWIFNRPYITSDLRVVPCSIIANPDVTDLGDARDLAAVWFGKEYLYFRQAHLSGALPDVCRSCYGRQESTEARKAQTIIRE